MHANQDIFEVAELKDVVCVAIGANEVVSHHFVHVVVSHELLHAFVEFHLVTFHHVFCDAAHPLIFYADLALLVPQVVVQSQELDTLLPDVLKSFLDDLPVVGVEPVERLALGSRLLVAIVSVPLQ